MKSNCASLSAICAPLLGLLLITPGFSQNQNKVLEWSKSPVGSMNERYGPNIQLFKQIDGIEIEDILLGDKSIRMGEPFGADIDWIRNITFRVKNISGGQLMGIQVTVILPEMNTSPQIVFIAGCAHSENQKCLMPGDEVELKFPRGHMYDWVKEMVAKERNISTISKAMISTMIVTLPNGMQWVSGCVKTAEVKNACPNRQ